MAKVELHGSDQLTTAVDHAYSATVAPGDVQGQVRATVANLRVILGERGARLSDVARLTVFVAEHLQVDLQVAAETLAEIFVDLPPLSLVGVSRLRYDDQVVELEAVAVL